MQTFTNMLRSPRAGSGDGPAHSRGSSCSRNSSRPLSGGSSRSGGNGGRGRGGSRIPRRSKRDTQPNSNCSSINSRGWSSSLMDTSIDSCSGNAGSYTSSPQQDIFATCDSASSNDGLPTRMNQASVQHQSAGTNAATRNAPVSLHKMFSMQKPQRPPKISRGYLKAATSNHQAQYQRSRTHIPADTRSNSQERALPAPIGSSRSGVRITHYVNSSHHKTPSLNACEGSSSSGGESQYNSSTGLCSSGSGVRRSSNNGAGANVVKSSGLGVRRTKYSGVGANSPGGSGGVGANRGDSSGFGIHYPSNGGVGANSPNSSGVGAHYPASGGANSSGLGVRRTSNSGLGEHYPGSVGGGGANSANSSGLDTNCPGSNGGGGANSISSSGLGVRRTSNSGVGAHYPGSGGSSGRYNSGVGAHLTESMGYPISMGYPKLSSGHSITSSGVGAPSPQRSGSGAPHTNRSGGGSHYAHLLHKNFPMLNALEHGPKPLAPNVQQNVSHTKHLESLQGKQQRVPPLNYEAILCHNAVHAYQSNFPKPPSSAGSTCSEATTTPPAKSPRAFPTSQSDSVRSVSRSPIIATAVSPDGEQVYVQRASPSIALERGYPSSRFSPRTPETGAITDRPLLRVHTGVNRISNSDICRVETPRTWKLKFNCMLCCLTGNDAQDSQMHDLHDQDNPQNQTVKGEKAHSGVVLVPTAATPQGGPRSTTPTQGGSAPRDETPSRGGRLHRVNSQDSLGSARNLHNQFRGRMRDPNEQSRVLMSWF